MRACRGLREVTPGQGIPGGRGIFLYKFFTPAIADPQGTDGTDLPRLAKDHHRYPTLAITQFVQIRAESPKSLRHQCDDDDDDDVYYYNC